MGDRGSKKAYTGPRTGMYLPTKFGCDRSMVVGCRSWNDRQTSEQNGMTIRLTLCERDATDGLHHRSLATIGRVIINCTLPRCRLLTLQYAAPCCRTADFTTTSPLVNIPASSVADAIRRMASVPHTTQFPLCTNSAVMQLATLPTTSRSTTLSTRQFSPPST